MTQNSKGSKSVFGKVSYGPCDVLILIFTSLQLSKLGRQGQQLSGGKTERSYLFWFKCKKTLCQIKNFLAKNHALLKNRKCIR
jgi:hypothetical protein